MSSYDVRVYHILANRNQHRTSHTVRWKVAGGRHRRTFATVALAESFRSKLIVAQREGVAFDETTGLPEPMARELNSRSWYEHAVAFVDMKWPRASGNHRKSIAESLATVTPALLATDRGRPTDRDLRAALYGWAFNRARREAGPPLTQLASALAWIRSNTVKLSVLAQDASRVRAALDALATLTDGRPAAANTVARKRAVFYGVLQYAVELRMLDRNPVEHIAWKAPESAGGVIDRKVVVNPDQARALLKAVRGTMRELEAFFGCLYYAALRPEEALHLVADEYERPARSGGWGWLHLTGATAASGGWGDGVGSREERGLKHRARGATRPVPAAPPLCDLLDSHLDRFGGGPGGRLFVLRRTATGRLIPGQPGPVSGNTYAAVWRRARQAALTPAQQRSPLARRPYDFVTPRCPPG